MAYQQGGGGGGMANGVQESHGGPHGTEYTLQGITISPVHTVDLVGTKDVMLMCVRFLSRAQASCVSSNSNGTTTSARAMPGISSAPR